ncbi:MAG: hypothetical protein QXP27_05295 [Candidatus Methanomethyliaceae archaeon]
MKSFQVKICVSLSKEHIEFLRSMIEKGEAETLSQAVRRCIGLARESVGKGVKGA